ncbi:hypothetical protein BJ741DRAFT_609729 [Chytriomyces cf. hyalinus JEL632]|nr:hypothetical protein BJ741DRAFT_609729 [Chytriomyces cf. hyalinus JEL632]
MAPEPQFSPCMCTNVNVNAMKQIKTSCASVTQIEAVLDLLTVHLKACTFYVDGSPIPTPKPSGPSTGLPPNGMLTKQCEAAQSNLMAARGKCGITNSTAKCVCKNLSVVEDVLGRCGITAASSSQQSFLSDGRMQCIARGGVADQTSAVKSGAGSLRVPAVAAAFTFAASLFM